MSSLLARITINPEVCHSKPVIRDMRYPVEAMLEYLAGGDTIDDLLRVSRSGARGFTRLLGIRCRFP
jgi:uncharacterized protein (DUF433 family)